MNFAKSMPALAATLLTIAASPVAATSAIKVDAKNCVSVESDNGCLFSGNIAPNTIADTQAAYNLYNDNVPSAAPDIVLNFLFKSDDPGSPGALTGTSTGGGWSTPGFLIDFIAVKSANSFVLYKLDEVSSSGFWSTIDIPHKKNLKDLSHLSFFGTVDGGGEGPVPEPTTWAMLLFGFGFVGVAMRRRSGVSSVAA